jgi:hypothetical protein
LLYLREVFSQGLHFPIDRQVLQQVTVKDIKILFVQGLFEVETCNVDSLTVERHLLQLLILLRFGFYTKGLDFIICLIDMII